MFVAKAKTIWLSYNAKWTFEIGRIVCALQESHGKTLTVKPCVQTYTFGQHNHHDLGNNHRPLIRFQRAGAPLYPDAIRVPSWRQENGDKRADPRGRVPGDVFDFTRVTGNSKQRRAWHPTQLNEGLVERCLKLTTPPKGNVVDPFAGTGTTLRVCKQLGLNCTLFEIDKGYCERIAAEHGLVKMDYDHRSVWTLLMP
jgi:DNA modification methylase